MSTIVRNLILQFYHFKLSDYYINVHDCLYLLTTLSCNIVINIAP